MTTSYCSESQIFFIYEEKLLIRDEDSVKDQILYFFPSSMADDDRDRHVGQLMGVKQFLLSTFKSLPSVLRMQQSKYVMKHVGPYCLVYGASLKTADTMAIRQLDHLHDIFCFYFSSFTHLLELCNGNRVTFIDRMAAVWNTLLPYVRHYDDGLSAAFGSLPYWTLSQKRKECLLDCIDMVQECLEITGARAGCLLFRDKFIYSTICPSIMAKLLILKPRHISFPCKRRATVGFELPDGVLIADVALSEEDCSWQQEAFESASLSHDDLTLGSDDITWTSSMCDHQSLFFQRSKHSYDRRSLRSLPVPKPRDWRLSLNDRARCSWPLAGRSKNNSVADNRLAGTSLAGGSVRRNSVDFLKRLNELSSVGQSNGDDSAAAAGAVGDEKRLEEEFSAAIEINGRLSPDNDVVLESDSDSSSSAASERNDENSDEHFRETEHRFAEAYPLTPDEARSLVGESSVEASPAVEHREFAVAVATPESDIVDLSNDVGHSVTDSQLEAPVSFTMSECVSSHPTVESSTALPAETDSRDCRVLHIAPPPPVNNSSGEAGDDEMITSDSAALGSYASVTPANGAVDQAAAGEGLLNTKDRKDSAASVDENGQLECEEPQSQRKPATIYAQANSDMLLVLLLDEDAKPMDKLTVRAVWKRSISGFSDLEPLLRDVAEEQKAQLRLDTGSTWLNYDRSSYRQQGSLSALHPVFVTDHAFCEAAAIVHENFRAEDSPREMLLRSGAGSIFAQCEGSKEVYVKGQRQGAKVTAGIPSRRDVDFCIQLAKKATVTQHSSAGSSTHINGHSSYEHEQSSDGSSVVVGNRR